MSLRSIGSTFKKKIANFELLTMFLTQILILHSDAFPKIDTKVSRSTHFVIEQAAVQKACQEFKLQFALE